MNRVYYNNYKTVANGRFVSRSRQALVLVLAIIAGILVSVSLNF